MPSTFIPSSRSRKSSFPYNNFVVRKLTAPLKSLQMIVWLAPSFTAAAISVSLIGLFMGPMFPIAINHVAHVLPRHLVNGTVGWMSACGAGGSALLPFLTGTMASDLGIESLQPLCVIQDVLNIFERFTKLCFFFGDSLLAMMIVLVTVWNFVPKKPKIIY